MKPVPRLKSVRIQGFRPFKDFTAKLGPLEVIVGANGSGKTSLFEFLRFLRDGMENAIPPGIVPGYVGQRVFHLPGPEEFSWDVHVEMEQVGIVRYRGKLAGPLGQQRVVNENVESMPSPPAKPEVFLEQGTSHNRRLGLNAAFRPEEVPHGLREFIRSWRFFGSFNVDNAIRRADVLEQEPTLREDASNITSVLHFLMTEHPPVFEKIQTHLSTLTPEFKGIRVKARGAPGEVVAFWEEDGRELTLADLSDGMLRLMCWTVLCVQPNPPPLICIDEPELGLHPRTLPTLAGLFDLASDRTQVIIATHSSYFLTQFDVANIAVMRKENGECVFRKPGSSKALVEMLKDFGPDEIETMHRSEELEFLA